MKELDQLSDFIAHLAYESLPAPVVERAKDVVRDTVGVILGGMSEPEVNSLAEYASKKAPGLAALIGYPSEVTASWAVLVHGTAGTTLEMDEGHAYARGHAAIHAVPPALALAQAMGTDGRQIITSLVAGYEVAARIGMAARLRGVVHPFGTWGVLGAAAVAGWYQGCDAGAMRGVLELAASYAICPSFETAYQGATVRNTYAGLVNKLGLLAADLYCLGFRGEAGGVETAFGEILGESFNPGVIGDGLGESYEIMRGYFKPYSGCRYTHAAIEAVFDLQREQPVEIEDLKSVEVATYDLAAGLVEHAPQTPLAGRFSLPFVVASTLAIGTGGPELFSRENLFDHRIRSLASRVRVIEEPEYSALTPGKRPARVTLHYKNGSRRTRVVFGSKGDPDQPMSPEELKAKFTGLSTSKLGPDRSLRAWDELGRLDEWESVEPLGELFLPVV